MKKTHRKILTGVVVALVPFTLLLVLLLYVRLQGFEQSLEDLVESQTNGAYTLTVGKSSFSILHLNFTLDSVSILRTDSASARRVRAVHIPSLRLRFGSARSMLSSRKFNIRSLTIDEPLIEIEAPPADSLLKDNINLAQQVVSLYPAIESLLDRFSIERIFVQRASVTVETKRKELLQLRLIDLLVKDWDIRHLTDSSQLRLQIAGQPLDFGKTSLNFSGMEFNFQEHYLLFSDFSFLSVDTVSGSRVDVSGRALTIQNLDYQDLYKNQRYTIKKTKVDDPLVTASFNLKRKKSGEVKDRYLMSRLFRQALGECTIDSTIIQNARVQLTFQRDEDTVTINLPRLNMKFHDFRVTQENKNFELGGSEIDLNKTAIALEDNLSLRFDKILYDNHHDLTITDFVVLDSITNKKIGSCKKLNIQDLDLLQFILYKQIFANTINIEDADIYLTHDDISALRARRRPGSKHDIAIKNVSIINVALQYTDRDKMYAARGLSMIAIHVRHDTTGEFRYTFKELRMQQGMIKDAGNRLETKMKDLFFNGPTLNIADVHIHKDSLTAHITHLKAVRSSAIPIEENNLDWKTLTIGNLTITGKLATADNSAPDQQQPLQHLQVNAVTINNLTVAAHDHDTHVSLQGKDLRITNFSPLQEVIPFNRMQGTLTNVTFQTPSLQAKAATLKVDYPATIHASNAFITRNDLGISIQTADVQSVDVTGKQWFIKNIDTKEIIVTRGDNTLLQAREAELTGTRLEQGKPPLINKVEVFKPVVSLPEAGRTKQSKAFNLEEIPFPENLLVHPGEVRLPGRSTIYVGELTGSKEKGLITCRSVHGAFEKFDVQLDALSFKNESLFIDSVSLDNERGYRDAFVEEDLIHASLFGLRMDGFTLDTLYTIPFTDISLNRFDLKISRDKRFPDPPIQEKPLTLEGLLHLPAQSAINTINLRQGNISYAETSDETGEQGVIVLDNVFADLSFTPSHGKERFLTLKAKARFFQQGLIDLQYQTISPTAFKMKLTTRRLDLTRLNAILVPLEALRVRSGYLNEFTLNITANADEATGTAMITYEDLHLEIFKHNVPDKKNLGSELLTLLADGIILRHSKKNASAPVIQPRIHHKSIFNYWVKSATNGALGAIRKGKDKDKKKK